MEDGNVNKKTEIERKFLLLAPPIPYQIFPSKKITQTYLSVGNPEHRIRKSNNDYFETFKGDGMLKRDEQEHPISREKYKELFGRRTTRIIKKRRYEIKIEGGYLLELDVYLGDYKGLMVVEIEFPTQEAADSFIKPDWFDEEITYDKRFKNKNLAFMPIPQLISLYNEKGIIGKYNKGRSKRKKI